MAPVSANPTSVYRWEDSSALEHSCWACTMKSNSPKAIHNCYGVHSIPCIAYHSTMHAIGTSHRCSGCIVSREMHDSRHREIARLVAEYREAKAVLESPLARKRVLAERQENMQFHRFVEAVEVPLDNNHMVDEDQDVHLNHDTVSTTTGDENHSNIKLSAAEKREQRKMIKERKSLGKAAKNEARHTIQVTSEDVKHVETILHGEEEARSRIHTHPLATDKTIEDVIARNLGFVKQIQCHKQVLYQSIRAGRKENQLRRKARQRASDGQEDIETEAVIDAILVKLGIENVNESRAKKLKATSKRNATPVKESPKISSQQSKIVAKLREAVRDDLEKHENDLHQTYIRAGGFFRYAGKAVFERMTEIAKTIDLETGEIREKKVRREAALELGEGAAGENAVDADAN